MNRLFRTGCVGVFILSLSYMHAQSELDPTVASAITAKADQLKAKLIEVRRDFHRHPELGNREVRTSQQVAAYLKGLGLEVKTGIGKTGVVGLLKGSRPGPVVALRADMDALPIQELNNVPYKSQNAG